MLSSVFARRPAMSGRSFRICRIDRHQRRALRIASAVDTTDLKRAEAARRESEERFRLAMNNVAAGVYTLDLNGLVTYMNPAAETMFGWTGAELLGRKMHELHTTSIPMGRRFLRATARAFKCCRQGGRASRVRGHIHSERWQSFRYLQCVAVEEPGETVGIVVGFRNDTPRREAERAIRESEERFRLIANTAPVMIWISDVDGLVTYVNQPWLNFTGWPVNVAPGDGWMTSSTPTKSNDAGRVREGLRSAPARFKWSIVSVATTGNIAGW